GFGAGLGGQAGLGIANRQAVIAVQAPQFLDEVDFQGNVEAVAGNGHFPDAFAPGGDAQAQGAEQAFHQVGFQFQAQHLGDAFAAQGDGLASGQIGLAHGLDDRAGFATDDLQQQDRKSTRL